MSFARSWQMPAFPVAADCQTQEERRPMPPLRFEFALEFLTPAFIGGATPDNKADLTLKPLKALMRYWWRQFQDTRDSRGLLDKESALFGSTKAASPVALRIKEDGLIHSTAPYSSPGRSGRNYLFYTCKGCAKWIEACGPEARSFVKVTLTFHSGTASSVRETLLALWLAATFGGLGTRSRRGAGSFDLCLEAASDLVESTQALFTKRAEDLRQELKNPGEFLTIFLTWYTPRPHLRRR